MIAADGVFLFSVFLVLRGSHDANEMRVTIYDGRFQPQELRVSSGGSVTWENQGLKPYTVTFRSLSRTILPQESWTWKITEDIFSRGENLYWDETYRSQGMEGKIIVR